MGCSNCKKKKLEKVIKSKSKTIFEGDRVITWLIIAWFFLGLYGGYALITDIF